VFDNGETLFEAVERRALEGVVAKLVLGAGPARRTPVVEKRRTDVTGAIRKK
jgi:hypothetical protein